MWRRNTGLVLLFVFMILLQGSVARGAFNPLGDPAIVGWWTCDEGEGSLVADSSPNGNDGTFVNGDPVWLTGVLWQRGRVDDSHPDRSPRREHHDDRGHHGRMDQTLRRTTRLGLNHHDSRHGDRLQCPVRLPTGLPLGRYFGFLGLSRRRLCSRQRMDVRRRDHRAHAGDLLRQRGPVLRQYGYARLRLLGCQHLSRWGTGPTASPPAE